MSKIIFERHGSQIPVFQVVHTALDNFKVSVVWYKAANIWEFQFNGKFSELEKSA